VDLLSFDTSLGVLCLIMAFCIPGVEGALATGAFLDMDEWVHGTMLFHTLGIGMVLR